MSASRRFFTLPASQIFPLFPPPPQTYMIKKICINYPQGSTMLHPLQLFKTLSDETRLSIVMLLREAGELCVCDLCSATTESQPKVSRHMALLRESGLVIDRREGKWVYYRLSPNMPAWAATVIDNSWNCLREETRARLKNSLPGTC